MKWSPILTALLVCVIWADSSTQAEIITFDSLDTTSGPVSVTDQFVSDGVIFEDLFVQDVSSGPFFATGPGAGNFSSPNVGIINDESPFSLTITATFIDPVTGLPGLTDQVEAVFFDSNVGTSLVKMTAFGPSGDVLGSIDVSTPPEQFATLGLSIVGINRVTLETDVDGTLFDNFVLGTVRPVPEPSSIVLFALGTVGLVIMERRRRKRQMEFGQLELWSEVEI